MSVLFRKSSWYSWDLKENTRFQQSRINGSKSKGTVTPEGQRKAATASLKHGMYAEESTLDWTIDQEEYDAHRQEIFDIWQLVNNYVATGVNNLARLIWRLGCLTAFGWDHHGGAGGGPTAAGKVRIHRKPRQIPGNATSNARFQQPGAAENGPKT